MEKVRNEEIDILKGLTIITVVLGHTKFWGTQFIYLFHMAVFFMASGYFYKKEYAQNLESLFSFIKRRVKSLWIPFFVWNAIYTLLNNLFISMNVYTNDANISLFLDESLVSVHQRISAGDMLKNILKGIFMAGHTELGGAFWFLRVLFYISVAYVIIDFVTNRISKNDKQQYIIQGVISVVFLCIGYFMSIKQIKTFALDIFFSCYCLYYIGFMLAKIKLGERKIWVNLLLFAVDFCLLVCLDLLGDISLGNNQYVNPVYMLIASIFGWFMLIGLSGILKNVSFIKHLITTIGQNSIYIVIYHFLSFKIVNLLYVFSKGIPYSAIAAFPVATKDGLWWILYMIVGTTIPVVIGLLWEKGKKYIGKGNHTFWRV